MTEQPGDHEGASRALAECQAVLQPTDDAAIGRVLDKIATLLEVTVPPGEVMEIYYAVLRPYPSAVIRRAALELAGNYRFRKFPLPADLKALCEADAEYRRYFTAKRQLEAFLWNIEFKRR